jgi:hypothetical protein
MDSYFFMGSTGHKRLCRRNCTLFYEADTRIMGRYVNGPCSPVLAIFLLVWQS